MTARNRTTFEMAYREHPTGFDLYTVSSLLVYRKWKRTNKRIHLRARINSNLKTDSHLKLTSCNGKCAYSWKHRFYAFCNAFVISLPFHSQVHILCAGSVWILLNAEAGRRPRLPWDAIVLRLRAVINFASNVTAPLRTLAHPRGDEAKHRDSKYLEDADRSSCVFISFL